MSSVSTEGVVSALELTALAEDLLRQRLRRDRPGMTQQQIEAEVARWYERRPGAEHGDAEGRPRRLRVA